MKTALEKFRHAERLLAKKELEIASALRTELSCTLADALLAMLNAKLLMQSQVELALMEAASDDSE